MKEKGISIAATMAVAISLPAAAHHSFAMFDTKKEVELKNATVVDPPCQCDVEHLPRAN